MLSAHHRGGFARVFSNLFCCSSPSALHEADEHRSPVQEQVVKSNDRITTGDPNSVSAVDGISVSSAATNSGGPVEAQAIPACLPLQQAHEQGKAESIPRPALMPGGLITIMANRCPSAPQLDLYLPCGPMIIPARLEKCGVDISLASADLSSSPRHIASSVGSDRTHIHLGSGSNLGAIAAHPGLRSVTQSATQLASTPPSSPKPLRRGGRGVAAAVLQRHLARQADGYHHYPTSSAGSSSQSLLGSSQSCGNLVFTQSLSANLLHVQQQGPGVQRMGGSDLATLSRIVQLCTRGRPLDVAMAELRATRERLQGRGNYSVPASPRASSSLDAIRMAAPVMAPTGIRKGACMDISMDSRDLV